MSSGFSVLVTQAFEDEVLFLRLFHQAQMYGRFVLEWS